MLLRTLMFLTFFVSLCSAVTPEEGKILYQQAKSGDADAQFELAKCFQKGDGVKKNLKEAEKWYRLSAKQGNKDSEKALRMLKMESSPFKLDIKQNVSSQERDALGLALTKILLLNGRDNHIAVDPNTRKPIEYARGAKTVEEAQRRAKRPYITILKPERMKQAKELIQAGANLNVTASSDLNSAVPPTESGYSPLSCALGAGDLDLIELLLVNGAVIGESLSSGGALHGVANATGDFQLDHQSRHFTTKMKVAKKLIELGFHPDDIFSSDGNRFLVVAVAEQSTTMAEFLIQNGADVNGCGDFSKVVDKNPKLFKDTVHSTPLMKAVESSNEKMVKMLLKHGADPSKRRPDGKGVQELGLDTIKLYEKSPDYDKVSKRVKKCMELCQ